MKARDEYDPYGNLTSEAGTYAATNRARFSTKYFDAETNLGYWGRRYYRPHIGRWLNRDPIEEVGGENLYAYAGCHAQASARACFSPDEMDIRPTVDIRRRCAVTLSGMVSRARAGSVFRLTHRLALNRIPMRVVDVLEGFRRCDRLEHPPAVSAIGSDPRGERPPATPHARPDACAWHAAAHAVRPRWRSGIAPGRPRGTSALALEHGTRCGRLGMA